MPQMGAAVLNGERIGRYTVLRRLAFGGMAEIYLARHEGLLGFAKLVVIKRILPELARSEKFLEMFLDESRLAARLSHPNIAHAFELGEHQGRYYLVMEYIAGESLHQVVKSARAANQTLSISCGLRVGTSLQRPAVS